MNKPLIATSNWQTILRSNFRQWEPLAEFLELDSEQRRLVIPHAKFPLNLPMRLALKIQKKTLNDPILKQFLPLKLEEISTPGFVADPVEDASFRKEAKLLKKYEGRALIVCTNACAMHCRYCFRQNFDYAQGDLTFSAECAAIRADSSIREVILSGGDPLSLSDRVLNELLTTLGSISHVKRIRFHTRFPIGIPERIDTSFLELLKGLKQQVYFLVHVNHARELDDFILQRLDEIRKLGAVVMNQAVLLRGVNDDLATLKELCLTLVDHGILPYYLNQLDPVLGSSHFHVPIERGLELISQLTAELSGYAVPQYVQESPGFPSKVRII